MAVLQATNVQGALCVNGVAVGGGKDFKYCCFTASTTFTPSQDLVDGGGNISTIWVAGGGGGGAACAFGGQQYDARCSCATAGAGGGGEVVTEFVNMTSSNDACTITIGAGGQSGSVVDAGNAVNSAKGGNTVAFGKTTYGGGGGMTRICSACCGCSFCCDDNIIGGGTGGHGNMGCKNSSLCVNPAALPTTGGYLGNGITSAGNTIGYGLACANLTCVTSRVTQTVSSSIGIVNNTSSPPVSGITQGIFGFGTPGTSCACAVQVGTPSCGSGGNSSAGTVNGYCPGFPGKDGIVVITWAE